MSNLNSVQELQIQLKNGTASQITTAVNDYGLEGEPLYTTDSEQLYVHDGSGYKHQGLKRTSTSADPTTTEYPNDKDAGIHKNTTSSNVFLAYNDGGTIKKVQLT